MNSNECICLSCGNHFAASAADNTGTAENTCPKCGSATVLKLNPSSLWGFLGGG